MPTDSLPLVVLVDGSLSLTSAKRMVVLKTVASLLRSLHAADLFALVVFHDNIEGYKAGDFCPASEALPALDWLKGVQPRGEANAAAILRRLARIPLALRVILLASGPVGDGHQLVDAVTEWSELTRLQAIAIETSPEPLRRLCQSLRGGVLTCQGPDIEQVLAGLLEFLGKSNRTPPAEWTGWPGSEDSWRPEGEYL